MRSRRFNSVRTAVVGAVSAIALVAGVCSMSLPEQAGTVSDAPVRLVQNEQGSLVVGQKVDIDLKKVVEARIGQKVPDGATLQLSGLPEGLTQDGWRITGTPKQSGLFNVKVTVSVGGRTSTQNVQLMVAAPAGQRPGGVVSTPDKPGASAPTTTKPPTSGAAPDQSETTPDTSTVTTENSENSGDYVQDPNASGGTGASDPACSTSELSRGIETLLPKLLGDSVDSGTANLIASLVGNLLPAVLGAASSDPSMACDNGPTGSIVDGANSLGQLGAGGMGSLQGMTSPAESTSNAPASGLDIQTLLNAAELARGILNQTGTR